MGIQWSQKPNGQNGLSDCDSLSLMVSSSGSGQEQMEQNVSWALSPLA